MEVEEEEEAVALPPRERMDWSWVEQVRWDWEENSGMKRMAESLIAYSAVSERMAFVTARRSS